MLKKILLLFFISLHATSLIGNDVIQKFAPSKLEILSKTSDPLSSWLKIFSPKEIEILENPHVNGNLIRLLNQCLFLKFTSKELRAIASKIVHTVNAKEIRSIHKVLKRFKLIKKYTEALQRISSQEHHEKSTYLTSINKYQKYLRSRSTIQEISHSLIIDKSSGKVGLMFAIEIQDDDIFDLFLDCYLSQNCPINARDYEHQTIISYALEKGTLHMVQCLYQKAEIELENLDKLGSTDLMIATKNPSTQVFDFVVKRYLADWRDLTVKRHRDGQSIFDLVANNPYCLEIITSEYLRQKLDASD